MVKRILSLDDFSGFIYIINSQKRAQIPLPNAGILCPFNHFLRRLNAMREELYTPFKQACGMAKEILEMPDLSTEQVKKVFAHVSNADMESMIHTLRHIYMLLKNELRAVS